MNHGRWLIILLAFIAFSSNTNAQTYERLTVQTGFNHDVIANGPGPAVNSSSAGIDSTGLMWANCLMSQDFQPTAAPPPAYALPLSGLINSASTAGLSYQLASYNASNSLWLNYMNSGTITFANQVAASRLYVLITSGHGPSTANGIINFSDGTTQNFGVINCPDWFNGTNPPVAIQGIGRVFRATSAIDNAFNNPRLYQYSVIIAAANIQKQIASIQFTKTNQTGVLNIFAVTAELSPCPIVELFEDDFELCPGADSTLVPTVANPVSYTWSDGSGNPTLTVTTPGQYWVEIQTSNCVYRDTVNVILPTLIQPFSLGIDLILCANQTVDLSPNNIQAGDYLWSNGSTLNSISVSGAGVHWLEVSNECGSYRDSLITTILPGPVPFSLGSDIVFCQGETRVLTTDVQTDMTYLWQNGTNQTSLTISTAGTYWLRIFNDCGAVADTIVATIPATPVAVLPLDTTLCNNATLLLNPVLLNNSGFYWQNGSTNLNNLITQSGTYTIYAFNQCDTVSDNIIVTYVNTPVVQLGTDLTPCEGETVLLTAYGNGNNYVWLDGSMGANFTVTQSGTYWAMASNYCGITYDTLDVRYILRPRVDLGPDQTLCMDETVMLSVANDRAYYLWNDGLTEDHRTVTASGEYALRAYNQCGEASDSIFVEFEDCSCIVFIPNAFTPDNDGLNDFFMPKFNCDFKEYVFKVFNSWGQMVFESHEPGYPWDGSSSAGDYYVKDGVYSYLLTYKIEHDIEPIVLKGSVTILR